MTIAFAVVLVGAIWIALAFLGVALFVLMAPALGTAGAAAATAGIFFLIVAFGGLVLSRRIQDAKRNAMIAGIASSGVANLVLGLAAKRPLLTLGIGGGLVALLVGLFSPSSRK